MRKAGFFTAALVIASLLTGHLLAKDKELAELVKKSDLIVVSRVEKIEEEERPAGRRPVGRQPVAGLSGESATRQKITVAIEKVLKNNHLDKAELAESKKVYLFETPSSYKKMKKDKKYLLFLRLSEKGSLCYEIPARVYEPDKERIDKVKKLLAEEEKKSKEKEISAEELEKKVRESIAKLSDNETDMQEKAREELLKLGASALKHLHKAIEASKDPQFTGIAQKLADDISLATAKRHLEKAVRDEKSRRLAREFKDGVLVLEDTKKVEKGYEYSKFTEAGEVSCKLQKDALRYHFKTKQGYRRGFFDIVIFVDPKTGEMLDHTVKEARIRGK